MTDEHLSQIEDEVFHALMEEAEKTRALLPERKWIRHWCGGMEAAAQIAAMVISKHKSNLRPKP